MMQNPLPLFIAIPLASAFLNSLLGKRIKGFSDVLSSIATLALAAISIYSVFLIKDVGSIVYKVGGWMPPIGIAMVMDSLTVFMLVTINVVAFLISVYSINYMEKYTEKGIFYSLFLLMIAGMNGVIISGDMFNLYVFLEIAAISSYALVAFGTEQEELEASFKYAVMGSLASSFILLGIVFLYSYTSTLNMADMAMTLLTNGPSRIVLLASVLFLMGFGLKSALVPFHAWLPDAHPSAPAPISAMLSGVLIKSLGVYAMVRIFFSVLGATPEILSILMVIGSLSIVIGACLALGQWDFKRLLAYSSINQIGYVILGISLGTPLGILGGLFHLLNHSVFKSLLFLNSGAVEYSTGTRDLQKMGGLREKMPVTALTSLVGSMSIAGVPPFNGFWSKLIIIVACVQSGHFVHASWAVLASIITLAYFLKVQKHAFFGELKEGLSNVKEAPFFMKFSMIVLAIICLAGGLLMLPAVSGDFLKAARDVVLAGQDYITVVFGAIK
ncbi:MAG: monovalent cation/H+ antiporter subunit D family protein [Candidatus Omnitrophica bacterium]|nr:monovalent cation/H+ antiporter subunit D family protein [Candidatus Omnitrophota bacterium]MBU4589923.1 monovalent cation/H+ antiporter subunit D family protein [Candidatus Omnitrophota bacterium]